MFYGPKRTKPYQPSIFEFVTSFQFIASSMDISEMSAMSREIRFACVQQDRNEMAGSPKKTASRPANPREGSKEGGKKGIAKVSKRRRSRKESYGIYIFKVLEQVHPDVGI